jgi:pimeloyl-ACP methyl ester carboxylesterase
MTIWQTASATLTLLTIIPGSSARPEGPPNPIDKAPSRFAKVDGIRVHYKSLGDGATAVVFVHGWTCDLTFWRAQVPALDGKTRILLIDLPGHGQSDKPKVEYTMDRFARAVNAVLKDAGVESAVLVGHSMGTPVIRQFYRLFPKQTRALVAVDGSLHFDVEKREPFEQLITSLSGPDYKENHGKFFESMFTPKTSAEVRRAVMTAVQGTPQYVAVSAMRSLLDPSIWKDDPIAVPVQVILAKSRWWSADYEAAVRKLAPRVDYRVMEGVGHLLMLENPEAFNELLTGFLSKQRVLKP